VLIHCCVAGWSAFRFATSLPHISPTGTIWSHQFAELEASFSYWNVPNTQPIVESARGSLTATSSWANAVWASGRICAVDMTFPLSDR
jgi:hypothetical protein